MKKTLALMLVFILGVIYTGCSDNSTDPVNSQDKGGVQFNIDKANAPANVASVEAIMISEYGDTLRAVMDMKSDTTAEISFTDIAAGTWYLTVNAYSCDSLLLYTGAAEIEIKAGILVYASLVLEPTGIGVGSVQINVTWGHSLAKTLTLQPGSEGKDAFISSYAADRNYGADRNLVIAAWTNGGEPNICRTLIDFNLVLLPHNAKVKSAKLHLFYDYNNGWNYQISPHSGYNAFYVNRVTSPWEENQVTWDSQPAISFTDSVFVPQSVSGNQDYEIDVTSLVQDYINDPENSFGFMCTLIQESPYALVILSAGDHYDPAVRPKLVVKYE